MSEDSLKTDLVDNADNYGSITEGGNPGAANNGLVTDKSSSGVDGAASDPLMEEWEIGQVYEKLGVGSSQIIFWTISFLIAYSDYAELTLIAIIIPYLRCEWDLSAEFESTITITIFLIYAISAIFCGKLADMYGRRRIMSITIVILIISAVGAALATNKWLFLAWRSVAGACIGANFATVVVYSTEFSPNQYRSVGPLIALMGSYMSMFIVNLAGFLFLNDVGWRWLIIIITVPVVPAWILLVVMPESPRYLVVSGKNEEAMKAIKLMAWLNKVELPDNLSVFCHQGQELGSFRTLLGTQGFRRPAILLSIMYFCNIYIETAVLVFLPLAFSSEYCGDTAPTRDKCATLSQSDLWQLSGSAFGSLVGCFATYFIANWLGRLRPLRASNITQMCVFCFMFVCFSNIYLFGVATVIKIINAIICMMIWFMAPESFPSIIRNTATGMINSSGKMGAVVGTAMVFLLFYVSSLVLIVSFLVIALLSCVCSFLLSKETNDAVLTET